MESFPQSVLDEILGKSDIVSVIGEHVALKRAGRSYRGLCPFHEEKTPSFYVQPDKQVYYCFGCGKGGNLFTFLMAVEKISFAEAVALAASRAGVAVPQFSAAGDRRRDEILEANRFAAQFYHETLVSPAGAQGFAYLTDRGIPEETVRSLLLGYAPREDVLAAAAGKRGVSRESLFRAGLLNAEGRDFFRNRVLFPIRDQRGSILGFGGRALDDSQMPKYLNTPETPAFSKSRVLFGLETAHRAVREQDFVIVVEGYFDVLRLHLAGFANAVAPLGTALTDSHLRTLRRFTGNLLLLFDADDAGAAAAMRSVAAGLAAGFTIKVGPLPRGFDTDSFIREYGKDAFRTFIAGSQDVLDYAISQLTRTYDLRTPRGKALLARELARLFSEVPDEIERDEHFKALSKRLDISKELIERAARLPEAPERPAGQQTVSAPKAEDLFVETLLSHPSYWERAFRLRGALTPRIEQVLACAEKCRTDGQTVKPHALIAAAEDAGLADWLSRIALQADTTRSSDQCEQIFRDCVRRLRTQRLSAEVAALRQQIRQKRDLGTPYEEELRQMQTLLADMKKG